MIYTWIHVHAYTYMYVYIYVYINISTNMYTYIHIYKHQHICIYSHYMCVSMCVCVCVRECVCVLLCVCLLYMCSCAVYSCVRVWMCVCAYVFVKVKSWSWQVEKGTHGYSWNIIQPNIQHSKFREQEWHREMKKEKKQTSGNSWHGMPNVRHSELHWMNAKLLSTKIYLHWEHPTTHADTPLQLSVLPRPLPDPPPPPPPPTFSPLHHAATQKQTIHSSLIWEHNATHCNTLQHTSTHCNMLQHPATPCNTLQHTATQCNTLQHPCLPAASSAALLRMAPLCAVLQDVLQCIVVCCSVL